MAAVAEKSFLNLVFTQPRTCSHLLLRILNLPAQSKIHKHPRDDGYFFMDTLCARFVEAIAGQGIASFKHDEVPEYYALLQQCIENLRGWVEEVHSTGKGCFVKEHVCWTIDPAAENAFIESLQPGLVERPFDFGGANANRAALTGKRSPDNDTVIPDELLKEFKPTILIRHPALAFSSLVRASTKQHVFNSPDGNNWELTFRWSKSVYDWYASHMTDTEKETAIDGVQFPIVLDGDDISNPAVMARYAKAVGLDEDVLQWSWPVAGEKDLAHIPVAIQYMIGTISNSEGVIPSKTSKGLDLAKEKEAWVQEFGEKLGGQLATMVDDAMPVYEWLKERRMTA